MHHILKCAECNETFGCSSAEFIYYCEHCAHYNQCVRSKIIEKLEIFQKHICLQCANNTDNQITQ